MTAAVVQIETVADRRRSDPSRLELDAERALAGVALLAPEIALATNLPSAAFVTAGWGCLWRTAISIHADGRPVDAITVLGQLERDGVTSVTPVDVARAINEVPTVRNADHYAEIVRRAWDRRRMLVLASELVAAAERGDEPAELAAAFRATADAVTANLRVVPDVDTYGGDLIGFLGEGEPDEDPSHDYVVHGIIPRGAPFIVGGHPKQGKTLLVEDLAIAIASGAADWCGHPISADMRGGRVLLMPREDSATETRVRIWRLARGRGIDPRDLAGRLEVDPISPLYLDDELLVAKLRRSVAGFDVVLIDSLQTIHRGDENSARDMAVVCGAWRDIALTTGKAVGLIHHFNGKGAEGDGRDPGHKLRGSSAIFATARHVVGIERLKKPDAAVVVRVSGNLSHIPDPFVVRRVETRLPSGRVAWGYEPLGKLGQIRDPEVGDAIVAVIAAAMPAGVGSRELRDRVRDRIEARNDAIDAEARALSREGRISRVTGRSPWRTETP